FRLAFGPLEAESAGNSDRIDEHRLVAVELGRISEPGNDSIVMRRAIGLIVAQCRIGAANENCEVAAFIPSVRTDRIAGPALDGEITGFQIHEQCGGGIKRPQQRGLADAGLAEDAALDTARCCHPFVDGDDGKCAGHCAPPFSSSFTLSAPVLTVRAGSKIWRVDPGQAVYLRSGTLKLTSDRKSTRLNSSH